MTALADRLRSTLAVAVAATGLAVAAPASATLDACQKGVEKGGAKLAGVVLKVLGKCSDAYRKAVVKGDPLADAAADCQVLLDKAIKFPDPANASVMQLIKNALALLTSKVPPPCTDDDLVALGHLPEVTFGDRWQRWILLAKLAEAYNQQVTVVRDTPSIFRALADAGGCPMCAKLASPPCFEHACALGPTSTRRVYAPALFSVAFAGEVLLDVCRYDDILPNDLALIGRPGRTIRNTGSLLAETICMTPTALEGYVACAGSTSPRVSALTCQDHIVNAPEANECAAAGFACARDQFDILVEHLGSVNSGPCVGFAPLAPAAGSAVMLGAAQISRVTATQRGVDGIACTADDTGTRPVPVTIAFTTATANALIFDGVDTPGNNFTTPPATGANFNCTTLQTSNLSGATLVGGFPTLHSACVTQPCDDPGTLPDEGNVPGDSATALTLVCQ